jgi:hypothetical protein
LLSSSSSEIINCEVWGLVRRGLDIRVVSDSLLEDKVECSVEAMDALEDEDEEDDGETDASSVGCVF